MTKVRKVPVKKASSLLRKARALIAKPNGWCRRTFAKNEKGYSTSSTEDDAVSFCMLGAIQHVPATLGAYNRARHYLDVATHFYGIPHWNDYVAINQKEVLSKFDIAISRAVEEEEKADAKAKD
jgi:hypothetical protein